MQLQQGYGRSLPHPNPANVYTRAYGWNSIAAPYFEAHRLFLEVCLGDFV